MRSADDNLVPSDKDLEHLLRTAQKSAAKKEAYKKTTKQYYRSKIVRSSDLSLSTIAASHLIMRP